MQGCFFIGALGRNRTGTPLLATDFKSAASTSSATSAKSFSFIQSFLPNCKNKLSEFPPVKIENNSCVFDKNMLFIYPL